MTKIVVSIPKANKVILVFALCREYLVEIRARLSGRYVGFDPATIDGRAVIVHIWYYPGGKVYKVEEAH